MNELLITFISLFIGAAFGLLRTWQTHGLRLIQPTITVRDRVLRIRLGWLASLFLGAMISWASVAGYILFFYNGIPETLADILLVSASAGYGSLALLNKLTGKEITDLDAHEFAIQYGEVNLQKALMVGTIMKDLKCVERIQIKDGEYAGVVNVLVVPRLSSDTEGCRKIVENYFAKYRPVGVQFYVIAANEIKINITLTVVLLAVEDDNPSGWYAKEIQSRIISYIDSCQPGEWIRKSKMISKAMEGLSYVVDIPDASIVSAPVFEENSFINISRDAVARAGDIIVKIESKPMS